MIKTTVTSGKYNFVITDISSPNRDGNIGTRSFTIGGTYHHGFLDFFIKFSLINPIMNPRKEFEIPKVSERKEGTRYAKAGFPQVPWFPAVNISYLYRDNQPISAKITTIDYEPECALNMNLEKGGRTAIMLKTLLCHVYREIPSISVFDFDDMSNIDCIEKDMSKDPPRKSTKPLSLAYLYMANYSQTWYEKHFDARMANNSMYANYRNEIGFLTDPSKKVDFTFFTDICKMNATPTRVSAYIKAELSKEINNQIDVLKPLYESSKTYQEFFHKIPIQNRCKILFPWLDTFMNHYLRRVYNTNNWIIDMNSPKMLEFCLGQKQQAKKRERKKRA